MSNTVMNSQRGFTLIEVLISMAVMCVVLIGVLLSNTVIHQSSEAAFERTRAMQDANRVIEQLRNAAQAAEDFPADVVTQYPDGALDGFSSLPEQEVEIDYADSSADPLDARVEVTWKANGRRDASVTLRTLLTQR